MTLLPPDKYQLVMGYQQLKEFPLINAVVQQKQGGSVFISDGPMPDTILVIHKSGFGYLLASGDINLGAFIDSITEMPAIPQYFHLYDPPAEVIDYTANNMNAVGVKHRQRVQLRYQGDVKQVSLPTEDYSLHQITAENIESLNDLGLSLNNKFWSSTSQFLTEGYGVYLTDRSGAPVSICYTACVADGVSEIDILTIPAHQHKGLAKIVTSEYIRLGNERRVAANWDCFTDNIGSLRTARSLGFKERKTYDFLSLYLKNRKNES